MQADDSPGPCALTVAAIGYDTSNQATQYYIEQVTPHQSNAVNRGSPPVRQVFVGFAGGNSNQFLRAILSSQEPLNGSGVESGMSCDLSGTLLIQEVPLLGIYYEPAAHKYYPIQLQQGRVIIDSDFNEIFDARRREVAISYTFDKPFAAGVCSNFLNFSLQTINHESGTTAAHKPFFSNYRPQFYFR